MQLSEIIIQKIRKDGPMPFRDFMEMALYHPNLGYYTSAEDRIGESGDYYTSCSLGVIFGAMIGRQLEEMWCLLNEEPFTIVEYGAGMGFLCRDILSYLKNNDRLYSQLRYCIIEKSPTMREKEKMHLQEKVSWYDTIEDIGEIRGCILSNELLDNFAVHQVIMKDELMEICVDYKNDFVEILKPAGPALKEYMAELNVSLPQGFRTEINLEATEWITRIAKCLKRGYVLTIDYGYPSSELYREYRRWGTIMCYNKHKVNEQPYKNIGRQDITAHVNFSALHHWGIKNGLAACGFTDQAHFLLALGFKEYLKQTAIPGQDYLNYKREAFLTQTFIMDMGNKFNVLIQQKGLPERVLSGLRPC